jgi:DNA invertase Pin-like site-specific DNA recombinase
MKIGYARVSTEDQDLNSQAQLLRREGCLQIFQETQSGKRKDRPELDKMLKELKRGDVVVVCKLDRLGRSLSHLLSIIEWFKQEGIGFKSLGESMDTTSAQGMMLFGIFGVIAEYERAMISERTKTTLRYLKSQGKQLGRPVVKRDVTPFAQGKTKAEIQQATGWSDWQYFEARKAAGITTRSKSTRTRRNGKFVAN